MNHSFLRKLTYFVLVLLMVTAMIPAFAFSASAEGYTKATSIAVGDKVVLTCESKTMELTSISDTSTKYGIGTSYTTAPAGTMTWTVEAGFSEGSYSLKNEGNYLCWMTGGKNSLNVQTAKDNNSSWTITFDANSNAIFTNVSDQTRQIAWNNTSPRFACYTDKYTDLGIASGYSNIQIFKLDKSAEAPHQHAYAWDGSAGADGNHALVCSNDDGKCNELNTSEACTWNTEHACSVCGAAETKYVITFNVPTNLTPPSALDCYTAGITLPELPTTDGYTAVGWAKASIEGSSTEKPEILDAGSNYTFAENTSLYAVYAQETVTEGETIYTKVDADDVVEGTYYLAAQKSSTATTSYYFVTGSISDGDIAVTDTAAAEVNGSIATLPDGAIGLTFTGDNNNGFTIATAENLYLSYTNYSNRKIAFNNSTMLWKVINSDAKVNAGSGIYLQNTSTSGYYTISENSTKSGAIRGYASDTVYRSIYLFKATTGTSTTYTYYTELVSADHVCAGNLTAVVAKDATCTEIGNSAYWVCSCYKYYSDANAATEIEKDSWNIPATGHSWNLSANKCDDCDETFTNGYSKVDPADLNDGDGIVIYYPAGNLLISDTASGDKLTGVSGSIDRNGFIASNGGELFLIVRKASDGNFYFETEDGRFLTTDENGGSLTLGTTINDCAKWKFETNNSTLYIYSCGANYNGTYNQAIEYYNGFTTYGYKADNDKLHTFEIYKRDGYSKPVVAKLDTVSLTLNDGVTVNVTFTIDAAWLAANPGAKVVFSNGEEFVVSAGTNTYSASLTPAQMNGDLTVTLDGVITNKNVSVAAYKAKVEALTYEQLNISEAKYTALKNLLAAIDDYAKAAVGTYEGTLENEDLNNVTDAEVKDENNVFDSYYGILGEQITLGLRVNAANVINTYRIIVEIGGRTFDGDLVNHINKDKVFVIAGLSPVNFDDTISIKVSDDKGTDIVIAELTFNSYLKALNAASPDNVIVAAFNYGLAAEAYEAAN